MGFNPLTEKQFLGMVRKLARLYGWVPYHTHDSRRSEPGFPDLVLGRPRRPDRPGRVIFAELKTDRGKVTDAQQEWIDLLLGAGEEVHVWRPSAWAEIEATLAR